MVAPRPGRQSSHLFFKDAVVEAIKDSEMVSVELCDVTLGKALDIVLLNKKMQAGFIAEKTIIIFHDNERNRRRYGQYELWLPPGPKSVCLQR
jgi:hypothetical protein